MAINNNYSYQVVSNGSGGQQSGGGLSGQQNSLLRNLLTHRTRHSKDNDVINKTSSSGRIHDKGNSHKRNSVGRNCRSSMGFHGDKNEGNHQVTKVTHKNSGIPMPKINTLFKTRKSLEFKKFDSY